MFHKLMFLGHLLAFSFLHIACSQILLHLPKYKIKKNKFIVKIRSEERRVGKEC